MFTSTRTSASLSPVSPAPAANAVASVRSKSCTRPAIATQALMTAAPIPFISLIANPCQVSLGMASRPASA